MSLPKPFVVLLASFLLAPAFAQTIARGHLADADDARAYGDTLKQLRARRLSVAWKDVTLLDAVRELRLHLGKNLVFAPAAEEKKTLTVTLELDDVSVATAMRLLQSTAKVRFLYEGGIVFVTTPEDAAQRSLEIRIYDVAELLYHAPDFPGPRMDLHPGKPEVSATETETPSRDANEMVELVRTLVGIETWEVPGASIAVSHHMLIVRQTPEVHAKIHEILAGLTALL
jgi:hypothetical protein